MHMLRFDLIHKTDSSSNFVNKFIIKYSFFSTCPHDVIIAKPFRKRMIKSNFRKHILKSIDFKNEILDQRQIYKTKTLLTTMITKANAVYMCTVGAVSI